MSSMNLESDLAESHTAVTGLSLSTDFIETLKQWKEELAFGWKAML